MTKEKIRKPLNYLKKYKIPVSIAKSLLLSGGFKDKYWKEDSRGLYINKKYLDAVIGAYKDKEHRKEVIELAKETAKVIKERKKFVKESEGFILPYRLRKWREKNILKYGKIEKNLK